MEGSDRLKELNMTADEVSSFTKAFKDEKFREMLQDYVQEISDPDNRRRYEEEIKVLEQERGNTIEFIHPKPFRAVKTSVDGKQKCFINICDNEKVGKPECESAVSEDGRRGLRWSLPHSLHPGRQERDGKGNKIMIYDVIFHPDTLHIASKDKRFMNMVDETAIQGIEKAFKVTVDKNNVTEMRTKYKGTPQPCVIRKPIPGYKAKEPSEEPDPLAFPYPDEKRPPTKPTESPPPKVSTDAKPKSFQIQPEKTKEPTKPNYAVKYRSFIDLQDFRYSRDSAQSPRPKEIVVTIDMPLLKSVADTSLEVQEKILLLESKKPAYRLELPLAYPVDEDKGEAKYNKQRGQLTVTLPVLPLKADLDFFARPAVTVSDFQDVDDCKNQDERVVEDDYCKKEREAGKHVEEKEREEIKTKEQVLKQETKMEKGEEREERGQEKGEEQKREGEKSEEEETCAEEAEWKQMERKDWECVEVGRDEDQNRSTIPESEIQEEEKSKEQRPLNRKEVGQLMRQDKDKSREEGCDKAAEKNNAGPTSFQCDASVQKGDISTEENSAVAERSVASSKTENRHVLNSSMTEDKQTNPTSCLESPAKMKPSDVQEIEKTRETVQANKQAGTDAASVNPVSREESHSTAAASLSPAANQNKGKDCCISETGGQMPATDEAKKSSRGDSDKQFIPCSEELATHSVKQEEREDREDNLPTEQIFQTAERDNQPPLVLLREIDKDGNETVISDHSTSAGFLFKNNLIFELD